MTPLTNYGTPQENLPNPLWPLIQPSNACRKVRLPVRGILWLPHSIHSNPGSWTLCPKCNCCPYINENGKSAIMLNQSTWNCISKFWCDGVTPLMKNYDGEPYEIIPIQEEQKSCQYK